MTIGEGRIAAQADDSRGVSLLTVGEWRTLTGQYDDRGVSLLTVGEGRGAPDTQSHRRMSSTQGKGQGKGAMKNAKLCV